MRLRIRESIDNIMYIDLIRGGDKDCLREDIIDRDDDIRHNSEYNDPIDTRKRLAEFLKPLASKIRKLHFIENAYVHSAKDDDNEGLSNYVRIIFNHPYGISDDEIMDYYYYTIRFSDHLHDEAEQKHDVMESYEVVGKKPKDLADVGWEIFEDYVDDIKDVIKQHEIDVYGYPKTML